MPASVAPTAVAPPPRRFKPSRWWLASVLIALLLVAAIVAAVVMNLQGKPAARSAAALSQSPGVFAGEQAMTGDELLTTMAGRIGGSPADTRTGTYELIHATIWNPEIQGPVRAVDEQTWHQPDGLSRYAIQRSRVLPARNFDPMAASLDFTGTDVRQVIQDSTVDTDLVDSPDIVLTHDGDPTAKLDWYLNTARREQPASSRVRIQELVSLYHQQIVPATMRAAILRLLAQLPDITFTHQRTTDRLHRLGIAFGTSFDDSEITLIVDPITGSLNAVHERFKGRLFAYTLFYPAQWVDLRGPTHPQPTPISTVRPSRTAETPASST